VAQCAAALIWPALRPWPVYYRHFLKGKTPRRAFVLRIIDFFLSFSFVFVSRSNNSNYRYHNHHKGQQSKNSTISSHGNYISAQNQTLDANSSCSVPVPPSPVHHAKQAKVEVPSSPNHSGLTTLSSCIIIYSTIFGVPGRKGEFRSI
jgi:hypothetical protein